MSVKMAAAIEVGDLGFLCDRSLHLNYLNNCLIPDTCFSQIEDVRFAKYCPIKTKEEAYNGC